MSARHTVVLPPVSDRKSFPFSFYTFPERGDSKSVHFLPIFNDKPLAQNLQLYFLLFLHRVTKNINLLHEKEIEKMEKITSTLRLRMSAKDAHYGGELVDGAHMVHLFGDVATELLIKLDGDEGLFCAYDNVEFLAPTYAGDYIEAYGEIDKIGNTSRHMKFEARKVVVSRKDINASAADFLEEPIVVARASGTCVTPKEMKRK